MGKPDSSRRTVRTVLTNEEYASKEKEAREAFEALDTLATKVTDLTEKLKAAKASHGDIEFQVRTLTRVLLSKTETREVECEWKRHNNDGLMHCYIVGGERLEDVEPRPPTASERQVALDLGFEDAERPQPPEIRVLALPMPAKASLKSRVLDALKRFGRPANKDQLLALLGNETTNENSLRRVLGEGVGQGWLERNVEGEFSPAANDSETENDDAADAAE